MSICRFTIVQFNDASKVKFCEGGMVARWGVEFEAKFARMAIARAFNCEGEERSKVGKGERFWRSGSARIGGGRSTWRSNVV